MGKGVDDDDDGDDDEEDEEDDEDEDDDDDHHQPSLSKIFGTTKRLLRTISDTFPSFNDVVVVDVDDDDVVVVDDDDDNQMRISFNDFSANWWLNLSMMHPEQIFHVQFSFPVFQKIHSSIHAASSP